MMKKQSRLAVLLAAILVCAMVCAGVALAAEVGMVETNASLDDFNNALSTDVVQAELVYNEILSKTALMDIFSVISNPDNNTGLYSLNVDQLNVLNQYVYNTYAAIESPSSMDEQCFAAITDQFQYIAYGYGVMLVAPEQNVQRLNSVGTHVAWYSTLSAATSAANNGDTLLVHNSFTETVHVKIQKQNLTIRAADGKTPTIRWNGTLEAVPVPGASSYHCVVIYTSVTTSTTFGGGTGTLTFDASGSSSDAQKGKRARVMMHCGSGKLYIKDGIVLTGGNTGGGTYESNKSSGAFPAWSGEIVGEVGFGAGIFMHTGTLEMSGGVIKDNYSLWGKTTAHSYVGGGAGVYLNGNTVMNFTGGTIRHNAAGSGGGGGILVGHYATLNMSGGTITENVTNFASGGGIGVRTGSEVKVTGGTISYNYAEGTGGGLFARGDSIPLEITGGTFEYNKAGSYGGGVLFWTVGDDLDKNTVIIGGNVKIRNNEAAYGGGISVGREVKEGKPIGNKAKLIIRDNPIISNNSATRYGGGIHMQSDEFSAAVNTVEISGGIISVNEALEGGGIYVPGGTVNMTAGTFEGNISTEDGAGIFTGGGTMTIEGGSFNKNIAQGNGGGVFVQGGNIVMNGGSFTENEAVSGGAAYVNNGSFTLNDGTLKSNNVSTNGGAVYVSGGNFTMHRGSLISNEASEKGGAVYMDDGDFTMHHGSVNENEATKGGAVYMADGNFTMHHGNVNENEATKGGAVYMAGTSSIFTMESGTMNSNKASDDGGAIFAEGGQLHIGLKDCKTETDTQLAACKHHTDKGAGRHHPIISGNDAVDAGGGIAVEGAGTIWFYCGEAKDNDAKYKGVGMNVFMKGGNFHLYDGANIGEAKDPGLVIVGGELNNECEDKDLVILKYHKNNTTVGDGDVYIGYAERNEWMNVPHGGDNYFWKDMDDRYVFVGWTGKGYADDATVRNRNEYVQSGTPVEIVDAAKNSDGEDQIIFDGSTTDKQNGQDVMHLYALWAPITNKITYVDGLRGLNTETFTKIINNPETYTNQAGKTETLTIQEATKPGYELKGWYIYQDLGQNANWGYEPVEKTGATGYDWDYAKFPAAQYLPVDENGNVTLTVPELTFGDITLVAKWEEQIATYTYIAVGPEGSGYVGLGNDTASTATQVVEYIGQATGRQYKLENGKYVLVDPSKDSGEPQGSTAIANTPNYKFVAWYDDAKYTVQLTEDSKYAPAQNNGLYVTDTFYALFDFDVADLTITKLGLTGSDSAVFKVTGYNTASSKMQTWYITLSCGNYTAIIKDMKIGSEYTITEMGDWSVYYNTTDEDLGVRKTIQKFDDNGNNPNTVEITNTQKPDKWLHDESYVVNFN